jgi:hypothetical protein
MALNENKTDNYNKYIDSLEDYQTSHDKSFFKSSFTKYN